VFACETGRDDPEREGAADAYPNSTLDEERGSQEERDPISEFVEKQNYI